jgi:hypothetical protein
MKKLNPIVAREWLFLLAGVMWTAVGIMLLWRAVGWLTAMEIAWMVGLGALGFVLGFLAYWFGFTHIVRKNIARLCGLPERVGVFSFNSGKGYVTIIFMIGLGVTLRHSPLPREALALLYTAMGSALLLASFHFYARLWQVMHHGEPCLVEESSASHQ